VAEYFSQIAARDRDVGLSRLLRLCRVVRFADTPNITTASGSNR
jgi:phosphopentomutase